jgi:hypothetical protein
LQNGFFDTCNAEMAQNLSSMQVLTASITLEVKNNRAQRILNKLIEVNISVGYMVLAVTTSKTINKI